MTPRDNSEPELEVQRDKACRDRLSTEHTENSQLRGSMLRRGRFVQGGEMPSTLASAAARLFMPDLGWERRDQTACKPGSVPPADADAAAIPLDRPSRDGSRDLPGRLGPAKALPRRGLLRIGGASSLFGLAPGGACHAASVAGDAVRSYRTLSPLPCAEAQGGLLSVALSLGSPPAGVTRRLFAVEPGLSSIPLAGNSDRPAVWSAGKVIARAARVKAELRPGR